MIQERRDNETLDSIQHSQADWIRQYMERQEEVSFECVEQVRIKEIILHQGFSPC